MQFKKLNILGFIKVKFKDVAFNVHVRKSRYLSVLVSISIAGLSISL